MCRKALRAAFVIRWLCHLSAALPHKCTDVLLVQYSRACYELFFFCVYFDDLRMHTSIQYLFRTVAQDGFYIKQNRCSSHTTESYCWFGMPSIIWFLTSEGRNCKHVLILTAFCNRFEHRCIKIIS